MKQPNWCKHPGALMPFFGCWSLVDGMVNNENYCKKCVFYKRKNNYDNN